MAQVVARLVRNEKVRGSNPLSSTTKRAVDLRRRRAAALFHVQAVVALARRPSPRTPRLGAPVGAASVHRGCVSAAPIPAPTRRAGGHAPTSGAREGARQGARQGAGRRCARVLGAWVHPWVRRACTVAACWLHRSLHPRAERAAARTSPVCPRVRVACRPSACAGSWRSVQPWVRRACTVTACRLHRSLHPCRCDRMHRVHRPTQTQPNPARGRLAAGAPGQPR